MTPEVVMGRMPERARECGTVLIFDASGNCGPSWASELMQANFRVCEAHSEPEARERLAKESFEIAVIGGKIAGISTRQRASLPRRTRSIFVLPVFSACAVLELARDADLILPHPLAPGTLTQAVHLVLGEEPNDWLARFAQQHKLSPRETELLRVAVSGMNNDEAAEALRCSRATVATFWNRIFRKTGVSGQRDVVILMLKHS